MAACLGAFNPANYAQRKPTNSGIVAANSVVQVLFWGSWWEDSSPSQQDVMDALLKVIYSPFTSGLAQYGCNRPLMFSEPAYTSAGALPNNFNGQGAVEAQVRSWVENSFAGVSGIGSQLKATGAAELDELPEVPIVILAVLSPPNIWPAPAVGGFTAFNSAIHDAPKALEAWDPSLGNVDTVHYIWSGWDGTLDTLTYYFSHELVELLSDPDWHVGRRGVTTNWNAAANVPTSVTPGSDQIADDEAPADRVLGVAVTPYWLTDQGRPGTPSAARRSSSALQSTVGRWGNFELLVGQGESVQHLSRLNDVPGLSWSSDAHAVPAPGGQVSAAGLVEVPSDGVPPGDLAAVVAVSAGGQLGLSFARRTAAAGWSGWNAVETGAGSVPVSGTPAFLYSRTDDLVLLVPDAGVVSVYSLPVTLASGAPAQWTHQLDLPELEEPVVAVAAVQANFGPTGNAVPDSAGNIEVITLMGQGGAFLLQSCEVVITGKALNTAAATPWSPIIYEGDQMQATGRIALWQSTFGQQGNFELLLPSDDLIVHYSRYNDLAQPVWVRQQELPLPEGYVPNAVTAFQGRSAFSTSVYNDFEAFVLATPPRGESQILTSIRGEPTNDWSKAMPLTLNGATVSGVTGLI
jgi:hypothetical protein